MLIRKQNFIKIDETEKTKEYLNRLAAIYVAVRNRCNLREAGAGLSILNSLY